MKFNAGIITDQLQESKNFYQRIFGWNVIFENDFYVLMGTENGDQLSFLLPGHPSQKPIFQAPFEGRGVYITIEVANVDEEFERIKGLDVPIEIEIRDEPWGDRHFAVKDPNGIGIDVVTYKAPE